MNIVIIGAGAVGGVIAGYLSEQNLEIQLVCKHRSILEAIENNGLRVEGIGQNIIAYPETVIDVSQIKNKPDIVLLAVKATEVKEVAEKLVPFLKKESMVISLQNGMCEDLIAGIVGKARTIGCVVGWGATMLCPGKVELTSTGEFIIGELNGEVSQRLMHVKSIFEKVIPVEISTNIYGALYSKLIINSCINTLGAITGLYLGKLLRIHEVRRIFLKIFTEAVEVAKAMNLKLEKIGGVIDPYKFALNQEEQNFEYKFSVLKKHLMIQLVGLKYRRLKSSSLQSLERGNPTEIDYLNGYIVRKANKYKIPVPVNEKLVSIVKNIETGKLGINIENLNHIIV